MGKIMVFWGKEYIFNAYEGFSFFVEGGLSPQPAIPGLFGASVIPCRTFTAVNRFFSVSWRMAAFFLC